MKQLSLPPNPYFSIHNPVLSSIPTEVLAEMLNVLLPFLCIGFSILWSSLPELSPTMSQSLAGLDIEALRETINASSQEIGRATDVLEAAEVAQNPSLSMLLTLGLVLLLIFVFVSRILVRALWRSAWTYLMETQDQRIGADGTPAPRGPAAPGLPNDDNDAQKEKLRKQIRKALALLLKKFCKHYCGGMGFFLRQILRKRQRKLRLSRICG